MSLNLKNKKIVVIGAGKSGIAAASLAQKLGAEVVINDIAKDIKIDIPKTIQLALGSHPEELLFGADKILVSPGVPQLDVLEKAKNKGIEVIGEVEFAMPYIESDIVAITGTNGKSTTVSLLGELFKTTGKPSFAGGNLGDPISDIVGKPSGLKDGLISLELSSFQLETIRSMKAKVVSILNLSEDHLDRYLGFNEYVDAKLRILKCVDSKGIAILNMDDQVIIDKTKEYEGEVKWFSLKNKKEAHYFYDNGTLIFKDFDFSFSSDLIQIPGLHNIANCLVACGAALQLGVKPEAILETIKQFKGLPHRMEFSGVKNEIMFYNDSKATNVGSVIGSLGGFESKYVLILGGKHKGAPYTPLIEVLKPNCSHAIVIGESTPIILDDLEGSVPLHPVASFEQAVEEAYKLAKPGESVILSPACSSYDMFKNYKIRGDYFKELVSRLS